MANQVCTKCGYLYMTEVINTFNFNVIIEEGGFADCTGESKYPEPYYVCEGCNTEHSVTDGKLVVREE